MFSDQVSKCYDHPVYSEDACKDCENVQESEAQWREKDLKDSSAVVSRTLTSQEVTFAEVLRERKIAECKGLGDYTSKLIGFGWILTPNERMLQSYEEAGHKFDMMVL